ncbi:MAG TPA: collagen-like protein [Solirubrobacteraceae bacterium]|nr:collagen-like protein [Solirubrobacteraceae bacterium]
MGPLDRGGRHRVLDVLERLHGWRGPLGRAGGARGASPVGRQRHSIQGKDIRQGTITAADIKKSTRDALKGQTGARGPAGQTGTTGAPGTPGTPGAPGAKGDQGVPGLSGLQRVMSPLPLAGNSDSPRTATVECPAGRKVVGTAFDIVDGATGVAPNATSLIAVESVAVAADLGSVTVTALEESATADDWGVRATALCAAVQ